MQEDFEEKDTTKTIENTIEEMLYDGDLHISGGKYIPASVTPLQMPLRNEDASRLLTLLISSSKGHPKEEILKEIARKLSLALAGVRLTDDDFVSNVISTYNTNTDENTNNIINLLEKEKYVRSKGSLNVRSGPSTNYGKIGGLAEGDVVKIISTEDKPWILIEYAEGVTG